MTALLGLTGLGLLLGLALGGSLEGWKRQRVQWWPLAVGPLLVQLVLYNAPFDTQPWAIAAGPYLFILAKACVWVMLVRNAMTSDRFRLAWSVAAIGVGLNLLVIGANGGFMPQSSEARMAARGRALLVDGAPRLLNVKPIDETTRLPFLGDVIAQPRWLPTANVISIGDLLLAGGLGMFSMGVTLSVRRATRRLLATSN
jgi:hypothetical protein